MIRSVISVPCQDDAATLYLAGGQSELRLVRQANLEISTEFVHATEFPLWRLVDVLDGAKLVAVTGKGKPQTLNIFDMSGNAIGNLSSIYQDKYISGATRLGDNFLVSSDSGVRVLTESGKITAEKKLENPVNCSAAGDGPDVAIGVGCDLALVDFRTSGKTAEIATAHAMDIRSVDMKGTTIVSGCEEGSIKFWDTRNFVRPVAAAADAHTHWVTSLTLNKKYGNIFISTGSDCGVTLWNLKAGKLENVQSVKMEDSVYSAAWSLSSPSHYISACYDGNLNVSRVPKELNHKISN